MKRNTHPSLTHAEEEIMQIIWKLKVCLVRDIIDELWTPNIPHSTVSSVVRILEKKGLVTHKAYGKTYEYSPLVSKDEYAQQHVQGLLQKYFSNSPKQLVSFLVQKNNIDLKELNKLMQTLSNHNNK